MAEELRIAPGSKAEKYQELLPQIVHLTQAEPDLIGVLDVDSQEAAAFDEVDQYYLERLMQQLNLRANSAESAGLCAVSI